MPRILQYPPLILPAQVFEEQHARIITRCWAITRGEYRMIPQDRIDYVHDLLRLVMRSRAVRERSRVRNSKLQQGSRTGGCTYG